MFYNSGNRFINKKDDDTQNNSVVDVSSVSVSGIEINDKIKSIDDYIEEKENLKESSKENSKANIKDVNKENHDKDSDKESVKKNSFLLKDKKFIKSEDHVEFVKANSKSKCSC